MAGAAKAARRVSFMAFLPLGIGLSLPKRENFARTFLRADLA
jgi:hypothetical protein